MGLINASSALVIYLRTVLQLLRIKVRQCGDGKRERMKKERARALLRMRDQLRAKLHNPEIPKNDVSSQNNIDHSHVQILIDNRRQKKEFDKSLTDLDQNAQSLFFFL